MKKALAQIGAAWDSVPRPIRDFVEGGISAAVGGATVATLGVNYADPSLSAHVVIGVAVAGAVASVIAYARFKLADVWRTIYSPAAVAAIAPPAPAP